MCGHVLMYFLRKYKCHKYYRLSYMEPDKVFVDQDFFPNEVSEQKCAFKMHVKFLLTTKGREGTCIQRQGLDHSHATGETLTRKLGLFKFIKTLSKISKYSTSTQGEREMHEIGCGASTLEERCKVTR